MVVVNLRSSAIRSHGWGKLINDDRLRDTGHNQRCGARHHVTHEETLLSGVIILHEISGIAGENDEATIGAYLGPVGGTVTCPRAEPIDTHKSRFARLQIANKDILGVVAISVRYQVSSKTLEGHISTSRT